MSQKRPAPHEVFTPGAPIDKREFFAGRVDQISRVIETIPHPGRHPIIFGQRGVGKTSLANILNELLPSVWTVKISCDASDTFESLWWNRILEKASVRFKEKAFGFSDEEETKILTLKSLVGHDKPVSPAGVANVLTNIKSKSILIFDEFDRVSDSPTKSQMADLIKNVSDNNRLVTIVLVGVGSSITDLIGEHPSIQ